MSFRLVRADVADLVSVGYFSIGRNTLFFNEEDGACAGDAFCREAVSPHAEFHEASPFIGV